MLAYVAVTRAKQVLHNEGLAWIHDDYTARPSLPPTIAAQQRSRARRRSAHSSLPRSNSECSSDAPSTCPDLYHTSAAR